jgi:hypothetical protein
VRVQMRFHANCSIIFKPGGLLYANITRSNIDTGENPNSKHSKTAQGEMICEII